MKIVKVAAAVIKKNNKILTTRRMYGDFKNMWEFPGGKLEPLETAEEAVVREIKEELELDIGIEKYITTVDYDYTNFHLKMDCFLCEILNGEIKLSVHDAMKWLSLSNLDELTWVPADMSVVKKLKKL